MRPFDLPLKKLQQVVKYKKFKEVEQGFIDLFD